jgi:hypothetical protein
MLRATNNSDSPAPLQVDVYCGRGNRFPLGPAFTVEPHKTQEIRIEAETFVPVLCWARVSQPPQTPLPSIDLRASLETLNGNQLEDFDRNASQFSAEPGWAIPQRDIAGQQLYILNASETPTVLTFCISNSNNVKACERKGANPARRRANPRQAVFINVPKFAKKYLIVESSVPGRSIIQIFNDDPGHRKFYSAESSISFDAPDGPGN